MWWTGVALAFWCGLLAWSFARDGQYIAAGIFTMGSITICLVLPQVPS